MHRKAWDAWSKHVRQVSLGQPVQCVTCRDWFRPEDLHAGHFIHGRLDFDEVNVNPQCAKCNTYLSGNLGEYALYLIDRHGREAVDDLRARANQHPGYSLDDLAEIVARYR